MPVRYTDTITIGGGGGGGGPCPVDDFSIEIITADTIPAVSDAALFSFGAAFSDTIPAINDALRLGLTFSDIVSALNDSLLSLGIRFTDTITAPTDSLVSLNIRFAETLSAPTDALRLGLTFADTVPSLTDARTSLAKFWLTGSAGAGVTTPANADGPPNATPETTLAVVSTAPAGASTETLTSACGSGVPAGTPVNTVLYRGWFRARTTLSTSTARVVCRSIGALFADITMFTQSTVNGDTNHLSGTFTFDLFAAGVNTLAKVQSVQIIHETTDAIAGTSPAILDAGAGSIEMTNVF